MYTFEPRSAVKLLTISTFPASILTLAPLWNTQPSMVTLPGVLTANVAPFSTMKPSSKYTPSVASPYGIQF